MRGPRDLMLGPKIAHIPKVLRRVGFRQIQLYDFDSDDESNYTEIDNKP